MATYQHLPSYRDDFHLFVRGHTHHALLSVASSAYPAPPPPSPLPPQSPLGTSTLCLLIYPRPQRLHHRKLSPRPNREPRLLAEIKLFLMFHPLDRIGGLDHPHPERLQLHVQPVLVGDGTLDEAGSEVMPGWGGEAVSEGADDHSREMGLAVDRGENGQDGRGRWRARWHGGAVCGGRSMSTLAVHQWTLLRGKR